MNPNLKTATLAHPEPARGFYRVAIVGAASLKGKEVAEVLDERNFPSSEVKLLDDDQALGQLEALKDEVTFIQSVRAEQFEHVDFTFFASDAESTRRNWRQVLKSGSAIVDLSYARETQTTINGLAQYRAGDRFTVTGSAGYIWSPSWSSSVNAFWNHGNRNDVLNAALGLLVQEAFNTNTDVFRVNVEHTYTSGALSIGPIASLLRRFRNSWDPTNFVFVPAKTRWSLGGSGQYKITDGIALSMRLEHVWTMEDESPDKVLNGAITPSTGIPALSSEGWIASVGAIAKLQ